MTGPKRSNPASAGKIPPSPPFSKGGLGGFESYFLTSFHPETPFFSSPSTGEGRVRVIMVWNIEMFCFAPPHPNPLPQGERGFPDGN